jgi:hypothetical protein
MAAAPTRFASSTVTKLSLSLFIACASLLPFTRAEAAGPVGKTYGNFAPETKFALTVVKRTTTRTKGRDVDKNVSVPAELPRFREGRRIRLTIGKHGQLTGPGFSIDFRKGKRSANVYAEASTKTLLKGAAATVVKAGDIPTGAVLSFYKAGFYHWRPVTYSVTYFLE